MSPANPDTVNSRKNTLRGMRLMCGLSDAGWRALALYGPGVAELDRADKAGKYFSRSADEILSVVLSFRGDGSRRLPDRTNDRRRRRRRRTPAIHVVPDLRFPDRSECRRGLDRKSTRLNSSH